MPQAKKKAPPVKTRKTQIQAVKKTAKKPAPKSPKAPAVKKTKVATFNPEIRIYPNAGLLFEETAPFVMKVAREAADARGRFVVALSGGSTPKGLFQQLTEEPYLSL